VKKRNIHEIRDREESGTALLIARRNEKKARVMEGKKPSSPAEWISLGDKLVAWSTQYKSVDIDDFARLYAYPPYSFSTKWLAENEFFAECFQKAIYNVGERRHAMLKDSEKYLMRTLPLYDWRMQDLEKQEKEGQKNQSITVEMKAFPHLSKCPLENLHSKTQVS
jgi:hypothetical protein